MAKAGVFFTALIFLFVTASFAVADGAEQKFMQGIISSYGSASVVLNETQRVNISPTTAFFDSRGKDSSLAVLSEAKWLYVEGTHEPDGSITAEKIYALPSYINKNNRPKYGFMQLP